jgi:hypothetical protein
MLAMFLESLLLGIAKHGVEGQELQVDGRLNADGQRDAGARHRSH